MVWASPSRAVLNHILCGDPGADPGTAAEILFHSFPGKVSQKEVNFGTGYRDVWVDVEK